MRNLILSITLFLSINTIFSQDSIFTDTSLNEIKSSSSSIVLDESTFNNLSASSKSEGFKLTWSVDYKSYNDISDKKFIVKYNTKIGSKRNKKGFEGSDWKYSEVFNTDKTSFEVKDLIGGEKYEAYLGILNSGDTKNLENADITWSKKVKAKTERGWGLMKFLILIGSLGLFIFGMKIMSDGLQRTAGEKLRKMLGSITSNRFKGVFTGFMSTSIVQSSSVTTVMTVSLVNAGLINLTKETHRPFFFLFDGKFDHLRIPRIPRIPRSRICQANAPVSGLSGI